MNRMDDKRIEMIRERCDTFQKWIEDWMMPAAGDFYIMYKDHLEEMGNEIIYDNPGDCYGDAKIIIHMAHGDSEEYTIISKRGTGYAKVSPIVRCKTNGETTVVDISEQTDYDSTSTHS